MATRTAGRVTVSVIKSSVRIEVAGQWVCTTRCLDFVAQAIDVGVVEAVAGAVHISHTIDVVSVETGYRNGGRSIIVAGQLLCTTGT